MLAVAVPSSAGGYGLTLSVQTFVLPLVALRVVGGFRLAPPFESTVDTFTSDTWTVGAGIAVYALRPTRAERFGASIRADILGESQTLRSTGGPGPGGTPSEWLVAFDGVANASLLIVDEVEAVAGGGVELSKQQIDHGKGATDTLPFVRGVAELGIRLRF
jgi:hypothetical protein